MDGSITGASSGGEARPAFSRSVPTRMRLRPTDNAELKAPCRFDSPGIDKIVLRPASFQPTFGISRRGTLWQRPALRGTNSRFAAVPKSIGLKKPALAIG